MENPWIPSPCFSFQTYLWVMNSEEDFRSAFEAGATGVMTDYPTKLRAFLDSNPQYTQDHKLS